MSLTNDLKHRLAVYQRVERENEDGETEFVYRNTGKIFGALTVASGTAETLPGEMRRAAVTHRLTMRPSACILTTDTYFVYHGQRYDVQWWQSHYKRRDRVEVMLRLVTEEGVRCGM